MNNIFITNSLPFNLQEDGLSFDPSFFVIDQISEFRTRTLRKYYLNSVTVFPKIVYKTYWVDDHYGTLRNMGLKMKATIVFPDIIGIEYAKTKTVTSVGFARVIECTHGSGVIVIQQPTHSHMQEIIPHMIDLYQGAKIVVPPGWSYTLINTGLVPLVTIDLLKKDQPVRVTYIEQRGAPLYLIERNGTVEIVKNSQYKNVEKYVKLDPNGYSKKLSLNENQHVVGQFCEDCDDLMWFHRPEQHDWQEMFAVAVIGTPVSFGN